MKPLKRLSCHQDLLLTAGLNPEVMGKINQTRAVSMALKIKAGSNFEKCDKTTTEAFRAFISD
jgi:hypothetical protein